MIGLPAPFYNIDAFLTTFLVFGVCPQRSPGTEDDRPPLPPAPCRLKRPARAPGNGRLTVWQTVRIVWSNIPLSCVVTDSSALSTPAANRSARILDIRLYVTRKRQNPPLSFAAAVEDRPLAGRQLSAAGGGPEQVIFTVSGKITCDKPQVDRLPCW